jgi:hypothetical protein
MQSCNDSSTTGSSVSVDTDGAAANLVERTTVNPQSVATYKQKVNDKINDYYFSVEVYETGKPLDYIVHLGYETMQDADTIHFPNLGYPIRPAIQKTTDSLSCYIGFIDPKGQFQYFKGVWIDKNGINIRTVRSYDPADKDKKSTQ